MTKTIKTTCKKCGKAFKVTSSESGINEIEKEGKYICVLCEGL